MTKDDLIIKCINFLNQLDILLAENQITKDEYERMSSFKRAFLRDCGIDM